MIQKVFLLCLLGLVSAVQDNSFCTENRMNPPVDVSIPNLPNELSITIEQTDTKNKVVRVISADYSQNQNQMHMEILNNLNTTETWIDTQRNQNLQLLHSIDLDTPDIMCQYTPLNGSSLNKAFNWMRKPNRPSVIAPPSTLFQLDGDVDYKGNGTTRANMPATIWRSCQIFGTTPANVTFYFASKDTKLPWQQGLIIASEVQFKSPNPSLPSSYRYDYVDMIPLDDTNKLLPSSMTYCAREPSKMMQKMPTMPKKFHVKVEQLDLGSDSTIIGNIMLDYHEGQKLIFMTSLANNLTALGSTFADVQRTVLDFNLGLVYLIDINLGMCEIEKITKESDYAQSNAKGKLTMKTAQQYFKLDKQYEFIGLRNHAERGIDCDVYISRNMANGNMETYIWYIAGYDWKADQMHYGEDALNFLPISMEIVTKEKYQVFNFYEYSMELAVKRLDYSSCFDSTDMMRIRMEFQGSYNSVYLKHAGDFEDNFIFQVMVRGNFATPSKVVHIVVNPIDTSHLVVDFTLLGVPKEASGIQDIDPPMKDIFTALSNSVENGFTFSVYNSNNKDAVLGSVRATSITDLTHGTATTDATHTHVTKPPVNPPGTRNSPGTENPPGTRNSPGTENPPGTEGSQNNNGRGTRYSPGEMTGLAFGSIAIGVLVAIAVFFLHRRFYGRFRTANGDGGMVELSTQS